MSERRTLAVAEGETLSPQMVEAWRDRIRRETFANYHYHMGVALGREGEAAAAVAAYRRALDLQPDMAEASFRLRKILSSAETTAADAEETHRKALAFDPLYEAVAFLRMGMEHYENGKLEAAAALLEEAVARGCPGTDAHYYAAKILTMLDRDRPAIIRYCRAAILNHREEPDLHTMLAWALRREQDFTGMERVGHIAAAIQPGAYLPQYVRAEALQYQGWFAAADAGFDRAARAAADGTELLLERGLLAITMRNYHNALNIFQRMSARAPKDAGARVGVGLALEGLNRQNEAEAAYRAAADSGSVWGWSSLALLRHHRGQFDDALAAHKRALELDETGPWYLAAFGVTLEVLGRQDEAEAAHRRAADGQGGGLWFHGALRAWAQPLFHAACRRCGLATPPGFSTGGPG